MSISKKITITISIILLGFTLLNIEFNAEREKKLILNEIKNWTFLFAENVRVSLNTLMREGKMDLRFAMFDDMAKELDGLKDIRVIRSKRVDEIFRKFAEKETIPNAEKKIAAYNQGITDLEGQLKESNDSDEQNDLREEISILKSGIKTMKNNIEQVRKVREIDKRETPRDKLEREILEKGEPIYVFESDYARVLIPYKARKKGCSETSGCHKYAKEGDVLGAINIEFSIKEANATIKRNKVILAGIDTVKLVILFTILIVLLRAFIFRKLKTILKAFKRIGDGDHTVRLPVKGRDELTELAEGFNGMMSDLEIAKELQEEYASELAEIVFDLEQAKEKIEVASHAKTEFLARMSHELRTPLNAIIGFSSIILQGLDGDINEKQREDISYIEKGGRHLLSLINEILDISKIESKEITLDSITFDLQHLIDDVLSVLSPLAQNNNVELKMDYPPHIPKNFVGDPMRIRQIITNLTNNAIKFTENGAILLKIENKEQEKENLLLKVSVIDDGTGIPEDKLDHIFEKFAQVETSASRKFEGTGLGLAICKQLVEMMDGSIGVNSKIGKGSTFWFTLLLPLGGNISSEKSRSELMLPLNTSMEADSDSASGNNKIKTTILLAEDNLVNQKLALRFFEKQNCSVDVAKNGEEAVQMMDDSTYDIVFMDCQMPQMDGYEATAAIREKEKMTGERTPIVALTASAYDKDREKCFEAGMDDYISKPVMIEEIQRILQQWTKVEGSIEVEQL